MTLDDVVWFVVKALFGIGFVTGLVVELGGSIALGVCIGCGLSFLAALGTEDTKWPQGSSPESQVPASAEVARRSTP